MIMMHYANRIWKCIMSQPASRLMLGLDTEEAADVVHFGLVVFFSTTTRTFDALAHYHLPY